MRWLRRFLNNRPLSKRQFRRFKQHIRENEIDLDVAYCTECGEWYNASDPTEFARHAH